MPKDSGRWWGLLWRRKSGYDAGALKKERESRITAGLRLSGKEEK
jgi:hypothetical protein